MKNMLYGTPEQDPQSEVMAQLAQEVYNNNILLLLVQTLHRIDFEVMCVSVCVYNNNILLLLVQTLHWIDFEVMCVSVCVYNNSILLLLVQTLHWIDFEVTCVSVCVYNNNILRTTSCSDTSPDRL